MSYEAKICPIVPWATWSKVSEEQKPEAYWHVHYRTERFREELDSLTELAVTYTTLPVPIGFLRDLARGVAMRAAPYQPIKEEPEQPQPAELAETPAPRILEDDGA